MAGVKRSIATMLGPMPDQVNHRDATPTRNEADTRTRTPSPSFPPLSGEMPDFSADASLVLVGIRGAGKSTLAIMASSAMKRKVIDLETSFQRATGVSSASYKKTNGSKECHRQQAKVLQGVLDRHRTDSVIVCSWMESRVQALLRSAAATLPVIHIVRDAEAIQDHLKVRDLDKMQSLLSLSRAIFRTCTNLEFFNVSEKQTDTYESPSGEMILDKVPAPYLTLKQAERHFLKFLSLILPRGAIPFIESASLLASIPAEELQFTYTLTVPLSEVISEGFDLDDHTEGANVVQIAVSGIDDKVQGARSDGFWDLAGQITRGLGVARRTSILPLVIHIELPEIATDDATRLYLELVSHTMRLAPDIVTIDLRLSDADISRLLTAKGRAKLMGDYFVTQNPPEWASSTWASLYQKASQLGCSMVRFVRPALSFDDNLAVTAFRNSVKSLACRQIPLIAFNTDLNGRYSACCNQTLTTVVSPKTIDRSANDMAHKLLTSRMATKALSESFVYDKMKLYVFGVKVGYSLSPAMHNGALRALGLPHHYRPHSSDSLRGIKNLIDDPYFGGASLSLPFKIEIIPLIHSFSRHARAIGAVNTLIPVRRLMPDGSIPEGAEFFKDMGRAGPVKALYGENTDWFGIRACIRRGLSPANAVRPATTGLIIGAGGMSRAAVYAMLQVGVQNIMIYNRTVANAEKMAQHFRQLMQNPDFQSLGGGDRTHFQVIPSREDPWPASFNPPTIIISGIPTHRIGDKPAPGFTVPEDWLVSRTGGVIVELGYKTMDTPLLRQARRESSRGLWVPLTGLDLLPEQGFAQFELFTGKRAPRQAMKRDLLRAWRAQQGESQTEIQSRVPSDNEEG